MNHPSKPSPTKRPFTADELAEVMDVARRLLLHGNRWRRDTFLMDASGRVRQDAWPRLDKFATDHRGLSPEALLAEFCTQHHPRDEINLLREKARFLKQLLQLGKKTPLGSQGMMLKAAQVEELIAIIPTEQIYGEDPLAAPGAAAPEPDPIIATYEPPPARTTWTARVYPQEPTVTYEDKMRELEQKKPVTLKGGEFLRYVLIDRDGNRAKYDELVERLHKKVKCKRGSLQHVFDMRTLPRSFQEKLEAMTHTHAQPYFWSRKQYTPEDAASIEIDWKENITALNRKFATKRQIPATAASSEGRNR